MSNKLPLTGEMDHDKRSMKQWMEDQGLDYVNTAPKVKGVKWIKANQKKPYDVSRLSHDISLSKTSLLITEAALQKLNCRRLLVGTGLYAKDDLHSDGEPILIFRPTDPSNTGGYCITRKEHNRGGFLRAERMLDRIFKAGLPLGKYKLYKVKDGFIAKHIT